MSITRFEEMHRTELGPHFSCVNPNRFNGCAIAIKYEITKRQVSLPERELARRFPHG